jgi:hypothetical protein
MARAFVALVLTLAVGCTDGDAPPQLTSGDAGIDQGMGDLAGTIDLAAKCTTACDCPAGEACRMGQCQTIATVPVFCCSSATCMSSDICEFPDGKISQCDRRDAGPVTPVVDGGVTASKCEMTGCSKGSGGDEFCKLACGGTATCVTSGSNEHCMP